MKKLFHLVLHFVLSTIIIALAIEKGGKQHHNCRECTHALEGNDHTQPDNVRKAVPKDLQASFFEDQEYSSLLVYIPLAR